jgi:hypothetical protein
MAIVGIAGAIFSMIYFNRKQKTDVGINGA